MSVWDVAFAVTTLVTFAVLYVLTRWLTGDPRPRLSPPCRIDGCHGQGTVEVLTRDGDRLVVCRDCADEGEAVHGFYVPHNAWTGR